MPPESAFQCQPFGYNSDLKANTALVRLTAPINSVLSILRDECEKCAWHDLCTLPGNHSEVLFNTTSGTSFKVISNGEELYKGHNDFWNQGTYNVSAGVNGTADIVLDSYTHRWYRGYVFLSFCMAFFLVSEVIGIATMWDHLLVALFKLKTWFLCRDYRGWGRKVYIPKSRKRIEYLDASRGFALILMIFVNYGGGGMKFFEHSVWNGLTVADLVFPHFLYVVGYTYGQTMVRAMSNKKTWGLGKRWFKLFVIGILLTFPTDWRTFRIMGVLQRIAVAQALYHLVRIIIHRHMTKQPDIPYVPVHSEIKKYANKINDVSYLMWAEWVFMSVVCIALAAMQMFIPTGSCPSMYMGPGGLHENGTYANCTGGLSYWIDSKVLGDAHMYQTPTCQDVYLTHAYDPDGIFGSFQASWNVFVGFQNAYMMLILYPRNYRLAHLGASTVIQLVLGLILSQWLPINKNLWTFSYSLVTSAISSIIMGVTYYVIKHRKWARCLSLQYAGRHAMELYVVHSLMHGVIPVNWEVSGDAWAQAAMSTWGVVIFIALGYALTYISESSSTDSSTETSTEASKAND